MCLQILCGLLAWIDAPAATHYVWQDSPNPTAPFTNWATAAHVIQEAVDAAQAGDTVLVTNGVYATGGRVAQGSRVAVDKLLTVNSVNGPAVTLIQGYRVPYVPFGDPGVRCVYLTNGTVLSGFTLTNGSATSGGGVWCESTNALVTNCILTGNSGFGGGGGAFHGTLIHCTLIGNSTLWEAGGGVYGGILIDCSLIGNSAWYRGGGAAYSTLDNCLLTGNEASPSFGGYGGGGIKAR